MVSLITDRSLERQLIAARQAAGADRYDEVWEGIYVMAPLADNEHQDLATELATILSIVVKWSGLGVVYAGANVSDQEDDWRNNYRCPDVAVFLKSTQAKNRKTHWFGGPDFAIEITSPDDRTLEKLPFYAKVGTHELLIIDREPWALTLYRLNEGKMTSVASSTLQMPHTVTSQVVPLSWRFDPQGSTPEIKVAHTDSKQCWSFQLAEQ